MGKSTNIAKPVLKYICILTGLTAEHWRPASFQLLFERRLPICIGTMHVVIAKLSQSNQLKNAGPCNDCENVRIVFYHIVLWQLNRTNTGINRYVYIICEFPFFIRKLHVAWA